MRALGGKLTLVCSAFIEVRNMPAVGLLLSQLCRRERLELTQIGLAFKNVIEPYNLKISAIRGVVSPTAHSLPTSVIVMDKRSDRPFVCEDVRANDTKKLGHRGRMATVADKGNGDG